MGAFRLECSITAQVPLEMAFRFFEDPGNLARITPPWLDFRMITPDVEIRRGAEIDYRIRWAGLRLLWKTVITEYDWPHYFVDEQVRGPYRLWRHRHLFRAADGGTEIRDRVDYALPFGAAGRLAHWMVVARQLFDIFAYRQQTIAKILGNPATTKYTLPEIRTAS